MAFNAWPAFWVGWIQTHGSYLSGINSRNYTPQPTRLGVSLFPENESSSQAPRRRPK